MFTYTYSNKSVEPFMDGIHNDVKNSTMTNKNIQYCSWSSASQNLDVVWDVELSTDDKTKLDSVVANNAYPPYTREGWSVDATEAEDWKRPLDLLIYYGWLNSFNSSVNGWNNEKVAQDFSKFGMLVFGEGLANPSHGDYSNTIVIIPRIKALNPLTKIFGYVACTNSYSDFCTQVDQWEALQVDGIFIDAAGYDYGTPSTNGRDAYSAKVDYIHGKTYANLVFTNAWNMDHIIGLADDASYPNSTWNPSLTPSKLAANDWYLLESFPINTLAFSGSGGYESKTEWLSRGNKAVNHRKVYGINLAGVGEIGDSNENATQLFNFGFISALMFSLEAFGSSDESYGASSAKTTYRTRPDVEGCGRIYFYDDVPSIQNDSNDADVYVRYSDYAKFLLDFSSSAQLSSIVKTYGGASGTSGYSGYSGFSGISGYSGFSGYSGVGTSGYSGYSGIGTSGYSGYSGYSGATESIQVLQLTSDQNTSSQSLGDCAGLNTFSLVAGATYYFRFNCLVQTNATQVGILLSVNASGAVSSINFISKWPTSASAWSFGQFTALQGGTLPTTGPGATSVEYILEGRVVTSGAVTFALQFRSETATQTTIKAGSIGVVERIA